ncbi:MAG: hypothetical protein COU11_01235 [Candidatus Harrisonbacteria bacterium CG10_big_fil_rev_8_21_14_0_10_49_15]|uniref:VOC domain-containing protein n=1 Tax=Candidatus Harrisonbacteria bacterium CG10_big_fil_rev_8_21_14_0_10_49_15 TaxID=1974587 RepID=A0A2H0ULK8_9BACT|nr:MAG: hypothetical protein COU11_01235 [Candidatus Harrisonbacteria bacterium CG10_big_fil_rev_8_21_14_0_10_49_15]
MTSPVRNNLVVELHVPDFAPIRGFYGKLGFEIISEKLKTVEHPGYLVMQLKGDIGNTIINFYGDDERVFNQSYFKQFPRDTIRGYAIEMTIPVADVDAIYKLAIEKLTKHVVKPLQETKDEKWTWRDFRMADPYGYYIRITELLDWGQE